MNKNLQQELKDKLAKTNKPSEIKKMKDWHLAKDSNLLRGFIPNPPPQPTKSLNDLKERPNKEFLSDKNNNNLEKDKDLTQENPHSNPQPTNSTIKSKPSSFYWEPWLLGVICWLVI